MGRLAARDAPIALATFESTNGITAWLRETESKMKPCKHLDYDEAKYAPGCTLETLDGFSCVVRFWKRNNVPYEGAPTKVQFCGQGRGRINGIFNCYNEGEMHCYEAAE